jgi:hypothetical protein
VCRSADVSFPGRVVRPQEHLPATKAATASRCQWQKPGPLLLPFFQDSELPLVYSIDASTNTWRYVSPRAFTGIYLFVTIIDSLQFGFFSSSSFQQRFR